MSLHCAAETYIKIKVPGADGAEGKAMSFMYFLAVLIGPLVKILYSFIGNYAATMIVATLILKGVSKRLRWLLPVGVAVLGLAGCATAPLNAPLGPARDPVTYSLDRGLRDPGPDRLLVML